REASMRWIRFASGSTAAYGILEGDRVIEVAGDPFKGYERTQRRHDFKSVKLLPPVIPPTFYCAGLNYTKHIEEIAARGGTPPKVPEKPDIGYRANNARGAPGDDVVTPRDATDKVQYEGELVVVIGKQAKHLSAA